MDSQWLKTQFQNNPRKSKAGLARYLNLEPPAISKILSGSRQIKAREFLKMQDFFGLTKNAINGSEFHDGQSAPTNWSMPASFSSEKKPTRMNIKIWEIQDDLMRPDLKQNESVIIDLSDTACKPEGIFLLYDGYEYYIRQCRFISDSTQDEIEISTNDKSFERQIVEVDLIRIVGRVIGKMELLDKA